MTFIIINPNSTSTMTDAMLKQARRAAPSLKWEGWTSRDGPPAIQGQADGDAATEPLLALVRKAAQSGAQGIVIGCFDDTALAQAAKVASCPVIGIGQASYHYAALRNWRFSVVTTLSVSVPVIETNIAQQGFGSFVAQVRASEVPVLALEADKCEASQIVMQEALAAESSDNISAVILGCAGMVELFKDVQHALAIETIDPVSCAARCMTWVAPQH